ncbi:MAG: AmmeMemoRadiSam system protein B [Elusimicrobiota bacterium]|jgi:hypothetical protein
MNIPRKPFFPILFSTFCLLPTFVPEAALGAVRRCAVAGQFYPLDPEELRKTVDAALAKAPEPKPLPSAPLALLVPHAGYAFSAPVAAAGYKAVSGRYDTVVILGAAHTVQVPGAGLYAGGAFQTPLGELPLDEAVIKQLLKDELFQDIPLAHLREHSIEVQLPFLMRRLEPGFKIVPIVMNTEDPAVSARVGKTLGLALKGRKALIIISSDLSHYPDEKTARKVDQTTLLALERMDPDYFWLANRILLGHREQGLECTYCGEAGLLAGLAAARMLGADRAELLLYGNSAQAPGGEPGRAVGYAAMAFVRSGKPASPEIPLDAARKRALLKTARSTIADALAGKNPPAVLSEDPLLNLPSAVFVTLTEKGALRGCIGTTEPRMPLLDAVKYGAYSAAFQDSRFTPMTKKELPSIRIEISLLSMPERIPNHEGIEPKKHGVIVTQGDHSGLFLPQVWEQIPDKAEFLDELCAQKAGLPRECWKDPKTELRVFTVNAFKE